MLNRNSFILNPFLNQIFTQLNMTSGLRGHNVGPFDASLVVVVNQSRFVQIEDRETSLGNASTDVSEVDTLFRCSASGSNFGFA
jgi:hypothetical protein